MLDEALACGDTALFCAEFTEKVAKWRKVIVNQLLLQTCFLHNKQLITVDKVAHGNDKLIHRFKIGLNKIYIEFGF